MGDDVIVGCQRSSVKGDTAVAAVVVAGLSGVTCGEEAVVCDDDDDDEEVALETGSR
jgi:hypothetical protein